MKISELMTELEKLKEEHGDLFVCCFNNENDDDIVTSVVFRPESPYYRENLLILPTFYKKHV